MDTNTLNNRVTVGTTDKIDSSDKPSVKQIITKFGVKPVDSKWPNFLRTVCFGFLIAAVIVTIVLDRCRSDPNYDISGIAVPGTAAYAVLMDLDEPMRKTIIAKMHEIKSEKKKSLFKTYASNVITALAAGVVSEYIVSGNATKPMNIVARTVLFTLLNTIIT